jgi:hypothetical protein
MQGQQDGDMGGACAGAVHLCERRLAGYPAAFVRWYRVADHSQLTALTCMLCPRWEVASLPGSGGAQAPRCNIVATSSMTELVLT